MYFHILMAIVYLGIGVALSFTPISKKYVPNPLITVLAWPFAAASLALCFVVYWLARGIVSGGRAIIKKIKG